MFLTFASLDLECCLLHWKYFFILHLEIGIFIEKRNEKAYSLGTCFESLHFTSQY